MGGCFDFSLSGITEIRTYLCKYYIDSCAVIVTITTVTSTTYFTLSSIKMNMEQYAEQLKQSNVTPGTYIPAMAIKTYYHVAILFDGKPAILFGPHNCPDSIKAANEIASHPDFLTTVKNTSLANTVEVNTTFGGDVDWNETCGAIIPSKVGVSEDGSGDGIPLAITTPNREGLEVYLSVHPELANILATSLKSLH